MASYRRVAMEIQVSAVVHIQRHLLLDHAWVLHRYEAYGTYPALELLLGEDHRLHRLLRQVEHLLIWMIVYRLERVELRLHWNLLIHLNRIHWDLLYWHELDLLSRIFSMFTKFTMRRLSRNIVL